MSICLKTYSKRADLSIVDLTLKERLPHWLLSPSRVHCSFSIKSISDYYLLNLTIQGLLPVICQRCLAQVEFDYHDSVEIALCRSEERADALMSCYDAIVVEGDFLDLEAVVVDELHLSLSHFPHHETECNRAS